jgi:hypothetical protein
MIADLDGYIARRAQELAAPAIEDAHGTAVRLVDAAERETRRQERLVAELRRTLEARDRQVAHWRELAEGKAADFILRTDEVRAGDRILDGSSRGLATVLSMDTYDDHLGISTMEGSRRHYLDRQPGELTAVRRTMGSES